MDSAESTMLPSLTPPAPEIEIEGGSAPVNELVEKTEDAAELPKINISSDNQDHVDDGVVGTSSIVDADAVVESVVSNDQGDEPPPLNDQNKNIVENEPIESLESTSTKDGVGNGVDVAQHVEIPDGNTSGVQADENENETFVEPFVEPFVEKFEHGFDEPSDANLVALEKIDSKCQELQQNGRYAEALEWMEKGLVLRQHFFGTESEEVWAACRTVGEMCNLLAMTYLQQEEFNIVLELLKKAEILTERDPKGRAVTFNNYACFHRRQGQLHQALVKLTDALEIESNLHNVENRADTHLNMCAVLSQLGRHQGALEHAQSALILLHEELFSSNVSNDSANGELEGKKDRISVLGIAYHNVGVEYEFLKKHELSSQSYKKGIEHTEKFLGASHGIVITLKNSLLTSKRKPPSNVYANPHNNSTSSSIRKKTTNKPRKKGVGRRGSNNKIALLG